MSKLGNEPAYPCANEQNQTATGETIRQKYVRDAMQGLLSGHGSIVLIDSECALISASAIKIADACLSEEARTRE